MINTESIFKNIIGILDTNDVEYKLFSHSPILNYQDALAAARETGFFGREGKCMVLRADDYFIVYVTLQGRRVDFDRIKNKLSVKKVRLATKEELMENFGAEPGCAYPFGFPELFHIYVDPAIYQQEWFLFSPLLSTKTIQAKGADLKRVFAALPNAVLEVTDWNE